MLGWLFDLFSWITGLWSKVPEPTKERIIDMIVETFEDIFRDFYRSSKQEKSNV